jgi:hypothetical protein
LYIWRPLLASFLTYYAGVAACGKHDHGLVPSLAMSNGSLLYQTAVLTLTTPFLR